MTPPGFSDPGAPRGGGPFFLFLAFLLFPPVGFCLISGAPGGETERKDELERRVDHALAFLKSMQQEDGSWKLGSEKNPAVTALAVMAFLSAGHVPGEGPYGAAVEKGVRAVLGAQLPRGLIASASGLEMYHHGISTLMLAEAFGMAEGPLAEDLKPALEKAVAVVLGAQRTEKSPHQGGWRYRVDSPDADVSVTGWQVLALRAARNVGCDVPLERIELAVDYLRRCRDPLTGGFGYMPGGKVTVACTGTSVLALEVCGKERHHSREALQGGSYLLRYPPRWGQEHFFYAVYYGAQGTFQLGNNYWHFYRPQLHKVLFDNQKGIGCWLGKDGLGPNYATAMAVLALTVEYRLLPIYQRGEENPEGN